jgi:hypothetical protein
VLPLLFPGIPALQPRSTYLTHGETAGNTQGLSGDERGLVGSQEGYGPGNVLRFAQAAEGDGLDHGFDDLGPCFPAGDFRQKGGIGRSGADAVDVNLITGHLPGHGLGESDDSTLTGGIDCLPRASHPSSVGTDADDLAVFPFHHVIEHHTGAMDGAF